MSELYIFSQDDVLLTTLSESTGLVSAPFREEINNVPDEPFVFTVDADEERAKYVKEENRVVFKDKDGFYREMVIKELDDIDNDDGPQTTATCIPAWLDELNDNIILDKRYTDKEAQLALNDALAGTRYVGEVRVSLGLASTNFYRLSSVDCIWKILEVWGGDFRDTIEFVGNKITVRKIIIDQRLGADKGACFEIDHNIEEIQRTVLSYPKTALYGWGASLQIEDEDGNHTGGYTRYIDFGDVVWSKAKGDPVDKPKGQKWVGDPDALLKYGRKHNGKMLHRYGEFSNQDYDDPAKLLRATWEALQQAKKPEVNYRLSVDLLDKDVSLGDTARAIDREFARPIEIQTRVIAIEYDLLDIEGTAVVEMGQFLSAYDNDLSRELDDLKNEIRDNRGKWESGGGPITNDRFPDIKPATPVNVEAIGGFRVIQLYWDYDEHVYISHYEVYGSQVKDFVPDNQHLLWRGRVSGFAHEVETDQVWYYRVRAVNMHGRPSDWSAQVKASTVRIISDDILFGPDIAAELRELSKTAQILADGTVDLGMIGADVTAEIDTAKNRAGEAVEKANLAASNANEAIEEAQSAFDEAVNAHTIAGSAKTIAEATSALLDTVSEMVDQHSVQIVENEREISRKMYTVDANAKFATQSQLTQTSNSLTSQITQVQTNLDSLEIGGRNLLKESQKILLSGSDRRQNVRQTFESGITTIEIIGNDTGYWNAHTWIHDHIADDTFFESIGENFTLSMDVKAEFTSAHALMSFDTRNPGEKIYSPEATISDTNGKWVRVSATMKIPDREVQNKSLLLIRAPYNSGGPNQTGSIIQIKNIKLEKGNRATDWSPAPEDLTTNVQFSKLEQTVDSISAQVTEKVDKSVYDSFVQQTSKSLASKVSQGEYDSNNNLINQRFSSITQTAQGLQTQVNNNKGNISTVTQLANALQSRMSNAEGNISTLTQTASSLQSTITSVRNDLNGLEIGGRNLIAGTDFTSTNGFSTWTNIGTVSVVTDDRYLGRNYLKWESKKPNGEDIAIRAGAALGIEFKRNRFSVIKGEEYTLSFIIASNEFNGLLDYTYLMHGDGGPNLRLKAINTNGYPKYKPFQASSDIHYHVVSHTFKADRTDDNCYFLIAAMLKRELNGSNGYAWFRIFNLQLEKGNKATDWTPAPEDMATQSQISQLSNAINLRVQKGDVINQINVSSEGILIDGKKVHITGQTKIDNAVIKTAMIANAAVGSAAIANAAITRAKLGTAVVGTAQIENAAVTNAKIANLAVDSAKIANAAVTNAKIASLRADKIDGGIINANLVTVKVTNGVQAIQLDNTGLRSIDSNGKLRIHLGVRNIGGAGQSDPATMRFFSGNGAVSASIGMNVNDHFIIGSQSASVSTSIYSGKNQLYWAAEHRMAFNNWSAYWRFIKVTGGASTQNPGLIPHQSGRGYIGYSKFRLWEIWTNNLHYVELKPISTREEKTNIKDADSAYLQKVFDQMNLVSFNYLNEDGSARDDESVGLIAEDSPDLITTKDKKALRLNNMIGVIGGSLKHQTSRIDQLENEFEWLKIENQYLKQKVKQYENRISHLEKLLEVA